jgi:hypothetical protein
MKRPKFPHPLRRFSAAGTVHGFPSPGLCWEENALGEMRCAKCNAPIHFRTRKWIPFFAYCGCASSEVVAVTKKNKPAKNDPRQTEFSFKSNI